MKKENLQSIVADKDAYDPESQLFIESLQFIDSEIAHLNSMKRTKGWEILETKIKQGLQERIFECVKNDAKIQTLLALFVSADTKTMNKALEEEIGKILP